MIKVTYLSKSSDTPKVIQCDHLSTATSKAGDFKLYLEGDAIFYGHLDRIISVEADVKRSNEASSNKLGNFVRKSLNEYWGS